MSTNRLDLDEQIRDNDIAIIGLAGRFPGAANIDAFWQLLRDGVEAVTQLSDEQLLAAGVEPELINHPSYIKSTPLLANVDQFDAAFFGFTPREAELMDPQQRLFLECVWQALEHAGYAPSAISQAVGLFGGTGASSYLLTNLYPNRDLMLSAGEFQVMLANDKDYLPTRVSFKLNLRGPSINVQTACSTSLVAVHLAAQSLLNGECDLAVAGGVSVRVPQVGYLYQEGMIRSPDGHCRAFDAEAQGTIGGSGVGTVVLKRLSDALADGDTIHAVIRGSAINNDGGQKVGYTAPSVDGQASVIAEAQALADVDAETITYVEAHGTGTPLGDPIEIQGLTNAFRRGTERTGFCAIGSVKTNIGHLDTAAGIAGLIKTVLALKHRQIPPSLHFTAPNPNIDFANSPFYVNTKLTDWPTVDGPRRAGVSSFGIGGTNAHVILEEAPRQPSAPAQREHQLLLLSAKSQAALDQATTQLAEHLRGHPEQDLADVAYTLQVGRVGFEHRRVLVCGSREQAIATLATPDNSRLLTQAQAAQTRPIVFMFSGQGAQYVNMSRDLYEHEPLFQETVDRCAELLKPHLGLDLRQILYPTSGAEEPAAQQLTQTALAQPALFAVEYALARLWISWGVKPQALIGHSIGEYVAATLAGVFSLEDALALVAARGQLMQDLPTGAMLSVAAEPAQITPLLSSDLALAAVNAPGLCVVAGPSVAIAALRAELAAQGLECRLLHTSHAFHSPMMEPILDRYRARVRAVQLNQPQLRFISNVSGDWISADEATDPDYWVRHLRSTVQFAAGLQRAGEDPATVLLEIGPGRTLCTFARAVLPEQPAFQSLRHPHEQQPDSAFLLTSLGRLWLAGVPIAWRRLYPQEQRRRVPLPTYPFERQRYWIAPPAADGSSSAAWNTPPTGKLPVDRWFYLPSWQRALLPQPHPAEQAGTWLLFNDRHGLGARLAQRLTQAGHTVITVAPGANFARSDDHSYVLNPAQAADYHELLRDLQSTERLPDQIVHLWSIADEHAPAPPTHGFASLLYLTQALETLGIFQPLTITVVATGMEAVIETESLDPNSAALAGPLKVIPQEYRHLRCRSIDVLLRHDRIEQLAEQLCAELLADADENRIAYRGSQRLAAAYEPVTLSAPMSTPLLRDKGVYLITGGLGKIGLVFAEYLAQTVQARLVLLGRSTFPQRNAWQLWLAEHPADDPTSTTIRRLMAIEAAGADVLVLSADVADLSQMRAAIAQAQARFGLLHGVFHAAGIAGSTAFRSIGELRDDDVTAQLRPKLDGLRTLHAALADRRLDFCVLLSSLATVLGGLGFAAYTAANLAMDAQAHQYNQQGATPWISIAWDGWQLDADQQTDESQPRITAAEGIAALERVLAHTDLREVVVSASTLQPRLDRWVARTEPELATATTNAGSETPRARPQIATPYVAPRNDVETSIAAIWAELLGVGEIGAHDDFFELGGHSLLATQVASRIRQTFTVELPLRTLFEHPTIAACAEHIIHAQLAAKLLQAAPDETEAEREEIEV